MAADNLKTVVDNAEMAIGNSKTVTNNSEAAADNSKADKPGSGCVECCEEYAPHMDKVEQVIAGLPNEDEIYGISELFKAFGDITRIRILLVLFEVEVCVCDLAEILGMTQSAVSHQLKTLRQARLIRSRREGKSVFYSLADDHVHTIIGQGREHIGE